jgi:hypothetical protein
MTQKDWEFVNKTKNKTKQKSSKNFQRRQLVLGMMKPPKLVLGMIPKTSAVQNHPQN